jgi:transposase InsO family protein
VKDDLSSQVTELQKEVHRLKIERDIYEKAAEIIKKDQGINLQTLTNREKAIIINALRESYQLKELLEIMCMAKSSYCYQVIAINTDKYADLKAKVKDVFEESSSRYGYRRIHSVINSVGTIVSEKVIRRIMKEENLVVPNIKRKKYTSYKGEISPEVENIVNREFHADTPNNKWLTDITEFHIPAGKVYLSPIIDCFDGLPVSWTIGTSPSAELVNTMLDEAILSLSENEKPIIHSDRGCHYRWPGWIERMEKAQLSRSMSKKGCSPDNSACEGFFGRLKNEMFYGYSWAGVTINQFIEQLDKYIKWYAEKRIKLSLGGMSPLDYRRSLGLAV